MSLSDDVSHYMWKLSAMQYNQDKKRIAKSAVLFAFFYSNRLGNIDFHDLDDPDSEYSSLTDFRKNYKLIKSGVDMTEGIYVNNVILSKGNHYCTISTCDVLEDQDYNKENTVKGISAIVPVECLVHDNYLEDVLQDDFGQVFVDINKFTEDQKIAHHIHVAKLDLLLSFELNYLDCLPVDENNVDPDYLEDFREDFKSADFLTKLRPYIHFRNASIIDYKSELDNFKAFLYTSPSLYFNKDVIVDKYDGVDYNLNNSKGTKMNYGSLKKKLCSLESLKSSNIAEKEFGVKTFGD